MKEASSPKMRTGIRYDPAFKRSLEWARRATDAHPLPPVSNSQPDWHPFDNRSRYGQLDVAEQKIEFEDLPVLAICTGYVLGATGTHAGKGIRHKIIGTEGIVEISRKAQINLYLGETVLKRHILTHTGEVWVGDRSFEQHRPSDLEPLINLLYGAFEPRTRS